MHGKLAALLAACMVLVGAQSSSAEVIYPWCAQKSRGSRNCGFVTFEQCRASVSGTGFCVENPFYQVRLPPRHVSYAEPIAPVAPPRRVSYAEPTGPVAPPRAWQPVRTAVLSAPPSQPWATQWCYLKGRRGDPQLFLRQQAGGCF